MFKSFLLILLLLVIAVPTFVEAKLIYSGTESDGYNTGAWPVFAANNQRTSRSTVNGVMSSLSVVWSYNAGADFTGPPVENHLRELIFGLSDGKVICLNRFGSLRWYFNSQSQIGKSPALDDQGSIYFSDRAGYFYSLFYNGDYKFRTDISAYGYYAPAYDGSGTVFVTMDRYGYNSYLYAIRNQNGSTKWLKTLSGSYLYTDVVLNAAGRAFVGSYSSRTVYCYDRNGSEIWHKTLNIAGLSGLNLDEAKSHIYTCTWAAGSYYVLALNSETGDSLWTFKSSNPGPFGLAIDSDNKVYYGDRSYYFYCLTSDGGLVYKKMLDDEIRSTATIDYSNHVIVPTADGNLNCLNPDGSINWKFYTGTVLSQPITITSEGNYVVAGDDRRLRLVGQRLGFEDTQNSSYIPEVRLSCKPNPFHDRVTIDIAGLAGEKVILIHDITGKQIMRLTTLADKYVWNASSLGAGVYIVSVKSNDKVFASTRIVHQ